MAAPSTAAELISLVAKSRLLGDADPADYLRKQGVTSVVPESSGDLADLLVRDGLLTRFQADNLLQGKWHRFFIGPYKVLEGIAAGSAGVVYLCEHARLRRRVAVKVLQGAKARDPKSLERFYREARAAGALDHPNIVKAMDFGQEDRFHYLVMEYVDGDSLRRLVKNQGPLSASRAADYLRQAALGLQHAHEAGLVHRDVKPTNLMVDRAGVVKILDLGLALFFDEEDDALTMGAVLGNLDYIAPEQVADSHAVDIRADIFSLGATFWYCLTGHKPARAGVEFLQPPSRQHRAEEPRADVPDGLWQVLRKMMDPDPKQRYQTPAEVAAAVAPWAPDEASRLLLAGAPADAAAETQPTAQLTAPNLSIPPPPVPVSAPAPLRTLRESRAVHDLGRARRTIWALTATIALLAAALVWAAWPRAGSGHGNRPGVPRPSDAGPYFPPVSPHSP